MLRVTGLRANYGDKEVLKGVDLDFSEKVGLLLGPNGSGKSTLIRAIAGSPKVQITSGKIYFEGRDLEGLPPYERARLGIGVAHQFPGKLKSVTVKEFLRKISEEFGNDVDVDFISSMLGIDQLLERPLNYDFSGGEIKRVEIATLIAQGPKLALIDEPDSGVDLEGISKISLAIRYLVRNGTKCLIVTHTGKIKEGLKAEIGFVMVDGRVVCRGNPEKILELVEKSGFSRCYKCALGGKIYEVF